MTRCLILAILITLPLSAHAAVCDSTEREDFLSFFFRFSGSKNFSTSRTVYPLKVVSQIYGIDEMGEDLSMSGVSYRSKLHDADLPSLANLMQQESMMAKVHKESADAFVVQVFGNNPNQGDTLHFSRKDNCWRLNENRKHSLSNQHWVVQHENPTNTALVPHFYTKPDNHELKAMLRVLNHLSTVQDAIVLGDMQEAKMELAYLIENLEAKNDYSIEGRDQLVRQFREALSLLSKNRIFNGATMLANANRTLWDKIN